MSGLMNAIGGGLAEAGRSLSDIGMAQIQAEIEQNKQARLEELKNELAQQTFAANLQTQNAMTDADRAKMNAAADAQMATNPTSGTTPSPSMVPASVGTLGNVTPSGQNAAASVPQADPLTAAVIKAESGGNQNAVSPKGATGSMQLMPGTARGLGVNANDKLENVAGGVSFLSQLRQKYGDDQIALSAYNWGPGNVDRWLQQGGDFNKLPTETQRYVKTVMANASPSQDTASASPAAPTSAQSLNDPLARAKALAAAGYPKEAAEAAQVAAASFKPEIAALNAKQSETNTLLKAYAANPFLFGGGMGGGGAVGAGADGAQLHGDDYLKSLDPNIASQVKALADGRMQFPAGFALKSPYWQGMLSAVSAYDPNFDAVNYNARAATRKDFTSGKSATQVSSLNRVMGHLDSLSNAADALDNSSFPAWNSVANWTASNTGDPRVKQFDATKKAVVDELTRVWRGSGGSEGDIKTWASTLDAANSPQQLHGVIGQMGELLESQISALQQQYEKGMGTTSGVLQLMSPMAAKVLNDIRQKAGLPTDQTSSASPSSGFTYLRRVR